MSNNPLQSLYRHKTYYTSLPSEGKFYKSGIKLSVDGELGIMPMSASDEIKIKTPDALYNGEALYDLIRSCVPDIVDPREIPVCDIDKILIGIRIATQGPEMEMQVTCPKCKNSENYMVNLTNVINSAEKINISPTLKISDTLTVHLRPFTLKHQVLTQIEVFHQHRMQKMITDTSLDEEQRELIFNESLAKAIAIQVAQIAESIVKVEMRQADDIVTVDDGDHILDWVKNMDKVTHGKIKDHLKLISDPKLNNKVTVSCTHKECNHTYDATINLNPVNFF